MKDNGGCSSARIELLTVAQKVAGSNPVTHPEFLSFSCKKFTPSSKSQRLQYHFPQYGDYGEIPISYGAGIIVSEKPYFSYGL